MSNMSSDRLLKRGCVCVAKSPLNTSEEISTKTVDMNMVLYTLGVCISGVQKSKVVLRQWLFKCADSTQKLNEGPMLPVLEIIQPLKFKIILYHLRGLFFQTHHFSIHSTIILGVIQTGSGKDASMCANRSFHRPQHSEGHHSFFFLDILTVSPLRTLYIAKHSWMHQAREVFWRLSQCFWEKNKIHNCSRGSLGRLGDWTYNKKTNDHTSWLLEALNITHWWDRVSVWGPDSGIFHQFYTFSFSCNILYGVDLFHTCWLVAWANSSFCVAYEYISISRLWSTVYCISPHPQSHPHRAKPKLFTPSTAFYEWESATCADLFSCPTVNTALLRLVAWKETEVGEKDKSDWAARFLLDDRICTWSLL